MERKNNEAAVCADSIEAQTGSSGEIDLYDELTAFAELPPDEQQQLLARPEPNSAEAEALPAVEVVEVAPPEEVVEVAPPEQVEAETSPGSVPVLGTIETVEGESITLPSTSGSNPGDSDASSETSEARSDVFVRPSGPLGSLTKGFVFTGALSRGVCLACGAESGTDDLFCITCGGFIEEISTTRPVRLACAECQQTISTDEIFCPWCGSSLHQT